MFPFSSDPSDSMLMPSPAFTLPFTPPPSEPPPAAPEAPAALVTLPTGAEAAASSLTTQEARAAEPGTLGGASQKKKDLTQAEAVIFLQLQLEDSALIQMIRSHKFPLQVALGFKLLIKELDLRPQPHGAQSEPSEWRRSYFSVLVPTVKVFISMGPEGEKKDEVAISFILIKLWLLLKRHQVPHAKCLDLLKTALEFLVHSQNQSKGINDATGQVIANIIKFIQLSSKNPSALELLINFLTRANPLYFSSDDLSLRCLFQLQIPYTEKNLFFLRIQIKTLQGLVPGVVRCVCELVRSDLLTKEMKTEAFTTLVHRASVSKEIVNGVITHKSDFLYLISAISSWLIATHKIVSQPTTATLREKILTENFKSFFNFSKEALCFAAHIFSHLRVFQDTSLNTSVIGVLHVLNYVLSEKNLDQLNQVVEWLEAATCEANSNAILRILCEQPNLADILKCISALLPNTKKKLKEVFLQDCTAFQGRLFAIFDFNTLFYEDYVIHCMESSEVDPIASKVIKHVEFQLCIQKNPMDFITGLKLYLDTPETAALSPAERWSKKCPDGFAPSNPIWRKKPPEKKATASTRAARTARTAREPMEVILQGLLQSAGLDTPQNNALAMRHPDLQQLTNAVIMLAQYSQLNQKWLDQVLQVEAPMAEAGIILLVKSKMKAHFSRQLQSMDPQLMQPLCNAVFTLLDPQYSDDIGLTLTAKRNLMEVGLRNGNWNVPNLLVLIFQIREANGITRRTLKQSTWGDHIMRDCEQVELLAVLGQLQKSALSPKIQLQIVERIITRNAQEENPLQAGIQFFIDKISDHPDNPMLADTGAEGDAKISMALFQRWIVHYTQTGENLAQAEKETDGALQSRPRLFSASACGAKRQRLGTEEGSCDPSSICNTKR